MRNNSQPTIESLTQELNSKKLEIKHLKSELKDERERNSFWDKNENPESLKKEVIEKDDLVDKLKEEIYQKDLKLKQLKCDLEKMMNHNETLHNEVTKLKKQLNSLK